MRTQEALGGLITEVSRDKVSEKLAYALLVATGILLTVSANIFEIISHASRGFAVYYAIQSCILAILANKSGDTWKAMLFTTMALVGSGIAVFGAPVE